MSNYLRNMLMNCEGESIVPLTFMAESAGATVKLTKSGSPTVNGVQYRLGTSGGWTPYTIDTVLTLTNVGDCVQFQNSSETLGTTTNDYAKFVLSGQIAASGNLMSMVNYSDVVPSYGFKKLFDKCSSLTAAPDIIANVVFNNGCENMFDGCTSLRYPPLLPAKEIGSYAYLSMFWNSGLYTAPELPATTLANNCYTNMFYGCSSLTTAPELPATTLAVSCYEYMFQGCALTTAPELPATTLAIRCYYNMFYNCTNLTTAPELPATTLAAQCYDSMFKGCTGLKLAPSVLPAKTLSINCYKDMFRGCGALTTAPELPATTLAEYCYYNMFYNCTNLTTAPELPATTLTGRCYYYMFYNCTNLTTAPELPATTLALDCYGYMFYGCRLLTIAPELPATTLANRCYYNMFQNCSRISEIKVGFTSWNDTYTTNWVQSVASSGTFKGPESLPLEFGDSRIPKGWNVIGPKGIYAEDCQFEFFTNIEEIKDLRIFAIPDDYTLEIIEGVLPNGLELTSDGKIKGSANEAGTFQVKIKITNTGFEKTINVSIICYELKSYDPVFYYPCTNENLVYVKNGSTTKPLYFSQISTSKLITFGTDENDIHYLKIGSNSSQYSGVYTLQAQNLSYNKFLNGNTDFTVLYKLKVNESSRSGNLIEIRTGGGAGKSLRIGLAYDNDDNFIYPAIDNYNGGDNDMYEFGSRADRALTIGQWYEIVVTYEYNTDTYKCYIDKVHKTTTIGLGINFGAINIFNIGSRTNEIVWAGSVDSQLSDITIWTKVLTDEEIQSL